MLDPNIALTLTLVAAVLDVIGYLITGYRWLRRRTSILPSTLNSTTEGTQQPDDRSRRAVLEV